MPFACGFVPLGIMDVRRGETWRFNQPKVGPVGMFLAPK